MTKTQQNLLKAFAGESQARNKYTIFAKIARKENFEWLARVFEETADNERAHAEELLELITEPVETNGNLSILPTGNTLQNLKMAAEGEKYEWITMYPDFEKIAKEEGETAAEKLFGKLKEVEEKHEERYNILIKNLEEGTLYEQISEFEWKCLNCGYIHRGIKPPEKCPVCKKPFNWYMTLGLIR